MWYLKACRSCLTTSGHFEKIGPQARRLFCVITGLQLEEGDGYPQYFCAECFVQIKKALQFRRRSRRAHFVLKEIHTIKKQVTQSDVEKVDRRKTNLISPYSCWKPEETVYSYTTPDAIETPEEISPDIEAAIEESLHQPVFDIQCNPEAKTIKIDIKPNEEKALDIQKVEEKPKTGELIKLELKTINSSSILVDIKPDNWEELEREEEERKKQERLAEINAVMHDIYGEDYDDGVVYDDTEVLPEDIDMEDIFKGLKEESEKEDESEPEPEPEPEPGFDTKIVPVKKKTKDGNTEKETPPKKIPSFLKNKTHSLIVDMLAKTKITYMPIDEQKEVFNTLLNSAVFQRASYKCGICITTFNTVFALCQHVTDHNEKIKFSHMCQICKDRFETEDELEAHGSLIHWYKYGCPNCKQTHYTLQSLTKCHEKVNTVDWHIKMEFTRRLVSPQKMYEPPKRWSGKKNDKFKCDTCKIYFREQECRLHMEAHKPATPPKANMECDICHLNFPTFKKMTTHMDHWHMYSYKCKTCKKRFRNRLQAKVHLSVKHKTRVCFICNKEFSSISNYYNHVHVHKMPCNMCQDSAGDRHKLLVHQLITHGYIRLNTVPELNDIRYYCEICKIYFTDEILLFQHLSKMKHPAADDYDNGCKYCYQLFDSKEDVNKHECTSYATRYPGGYPKKCPDCEIICESSWKYRAHRARFHSENPQPGDEEMRLCETCGNVISVKYYHAHKRKQHGINKPVKPGHVEIPCRFCPMKSPSASHHVSHILFNHTDKPYRCNICGSRHTHRVKCRDHILRRHAPVLPYACEACDRHFAHLDFLNEHCRKAHGVDLKKTDKSVYNSKRMFGKIYTYPDMKMDGSLIDLSILERTPVEICDYLDENNKVIDYKEVFFFDHDVDPSKPTREPPPPKINRKRTLEEHREQYQKKKQRRLQKKIEKVKVESGKSLPDIGYIEEVVKDDEFEMNEDNAEESRGEVVKDDEFEMNEDNAEESRGEESNEVMETEDVMGQLIEKDGEYFVLVDGELYSLEEDCVENLKATGEAQSVVFQ